MATDHKAQLDEIAKLEDGWGDYDAGRAVDKGALKMARAFIENGEFVPIASGGIQWHAMAGDWELTVAFNPDGTATLIYA